MGAGVRIGGLLCAAASVGVLLSPRPALARASSRLEYFRGAGAESCPDEVALRTSVATRLGYDPFQPDAVTRVAARIERTRRGFEGHLLYYDASGTLRGDRELTSPKDDCTELAEAMAVTMSILLDPRSLTRKPASAPAQPLSTPAPPPANENPFVPEQPPPSPPASSGEPLNVRVGAGAVGSLGSGPSLAPGIEAFAGVGKRAWSVDVEGRAEFPTERIRPDGTGVRSSLLLGAVVPCIHAGAFLACPLLFLGALQGEGVNVGDPQRGATFYAAAGLRAGFEQPLSRLLAVRLHTDLVAPLTRTTLSDRGVEVWTTPIVFASSGLGLVGRF